MMERLQRAFIDTGAIPMRVLHSAMLLVAQRAAREVAVSGRGEIRDALAGVLCRCTGYVKPIEAIALAAREVEVGGQHV